ncbi:hypothetical protein ACIGXI_36150 [Kitasatospora aureofaciens]|uniref:hypothetical protein n=1 Tax=Kitasatospora aureofaciens TaxID=1894 RepID=UPI0037CBC1E8
MLPGPVTPDSAEAASGERAGDKRPASGLSVERQRMLGAAEAIRNRAEAFPAAVDDDPLAAHAELARRVHGLASLLITSAREVRDQVRWPGLDADARTAARIREEWDLPDPDPNSDRGDFPAPLRGDADTGETHRFEIDATPAARPAAPKTPRAETTGTTAGTDEHAPQRSSVVGKPAAPVAPVAPAGLPDEVPVPEPVLGQATGWTPPTDRGLGEANRDYTLGGGLIHLTWPSAPGIQALEQRGRQVGWTEIYDDLGNWIALVSARPVADAADGELLLSANPSDALTLLRLALDRSLGDR